MYLCFDFVITLVQRNTSTRSVLVTNELCYELLSWTGLQGARTQIPFLYCEKQG
jgi:hypothetical protein